MAYNKVVVVVVARQAPMQAGRQRGGREGGRPQQPGRTPLFGEVGYEPLRDLQTGRV